MVTFYIVKDLDTGDYIHNQCERSRGFTNDELARANSGARPRLFTSQASAFAALRWWLAGRTSVMQVGSFEFGDCDESWHTEEVPERKLKNMDVVPLELDI